MEFSEYPVSGVQTHLKRDACREAGKKEKHFREDDAKWKLMEGGNTPRGKAEPGDEEAGRDGSQ